MADIHLKYNFIIIYLMGTSNKQADVLSRWPMFTFREEGTTVAMENPMPAPDQ